MSTLKMKGVFKGLRYISHIFEEEEKEEEIRIGFPTDVKHVAHIGWDGQSVDDASPNWMKEYTPPTPYQSAPLDPPGEHKEEPEIKWVSEDSRRGNRAPNSQDDLPDLPKSSRRSSSTRDNSTGDFPRKKEKLRQSRRSKDSSDGGSVRSSRRQKESNEGGAGSPAALALPDIPKKSRRNKSKDSVSNEGSSRSRSERGPASDPFSDLGPAVLS